MRMNFKQLLMKSVKDPFGMEVFIGQSVSRFNERTGYSGEELDDITAVIERPAMIFKIKESESEFYYLRLIGWNRIMLIEVRRIDDHLEAINYEINPSIQRFAELRNKGEQLL
jgi:hypothetical protein